MVDERLSLSLGIHHMSKFNNYDLSYDVIEIFILMVDCILYFNQIEDFGLDKNIRKNYF